MNVRRFAALDMHGATGSALRRRLVLAEFPLALAGGLALGGWIVAAASGLAGRLIGIVLIGVGLNYAPLTIYAIALRRPESLEAELAGLDIGQELRRYTIYSLWLFVPLVLVGGAVASRRGRDRSASADGQ